MKVLLGLVLMQVTAMGAVCKDIKTCILKVSDITGKTYILDKDIKGDVTLSENFKLTKENADDFISEVLNIGGYTRVESNSADYKVINNRDVRYSAVKLYEYGQDDIPKNHDYIMVSIKLKNKYMTSEISRNFRPFMSRYGRIIDVTDTGTLIISDTGRNIHRLIGLVQKLDRKPTDEDKESFEKAKRHERKMKELKAKNCGDHKHS
jgi:type II secretory pathway component GspD/PulD (secretin)